MYGSFIVGPKLLITSQDRKALYSFFDDKESGNTGIRYLDLSPRWKSTTQVSQELGESSKRTKKRLDKLRALGLVELLTINVSTKRTDYYWYITKTGLYYILSKLRRAKMVRFLDTNRDRITEFGYMQELVVRNRPEGSHLIKNLKKFERNRQYDQMLPFVRGLVTRIYGINAFSYLPCRPSIKDTIKGKYGTQTLKKLQRRFGKMI